MKKIYMVFFIALFLLASNNAWAMKRYYITPVTAGTDIDGNPTNDAKINQYPGNKVLNIPTGPDGLALQNWAIVEVAGTPQQHQAILSDPDIMPVPHNDNPDQSLNPVATAFRNYMSARGVSINSNDSIREIVSKSGQKNNANFNFERFSISE